MFRHLKSHHSNASSLFTYRSRKPINHPTGNFNSFKCFSYFPSRSHFFTVATYLESIRLFNSNSRNKDPQSSSGFRRLENYPSFHLVIESFVALILQNRTSKRRLVNLRENSHPKGTPRQRKSRLFLVARKRTFSPINRSAYPSIAQVDVGESRNDIKYFIKVQ